MENNYELMLVVAPDLKEDQLTSVKAQVIEDMTGLGAVIEKEDDWGKRDLAFEVKDYHQGYYHLVTFKAPHDLPNKLRGILKVNERVIRYLITRIIAKPLPPVDEDRAKQSSNEKKPINDKPQAKEAEAVSETKTEPEAPPVEGGK